ncbi:MAG: MFS transporter [Chloroflexi bacterium]|nr:MFS transporter [Chloroflexota bacterium]
MSLTAGVARLWSPTFTLLCGSMLLGYAGSALLVPAVPLYINALGGSAAVIGLVLAAYSLASLASRPLVGRWSDTWSPSGVHGVGALVLAGAAFGHLIPLIPVLALVGAVRGLGWGALNTGAYTLLADVAPATRRAEASAYFNLFQTVPHTLVPAVAVWLIGVPGAGFGATFLLAGTLPLLAAGVAAALSRRMARPERRPIERPAGARGLLRAFAISDRVVLLATALSACAAMTFPPVVAFLPLAAQARGIEGVEWYYVANAAAGISSRLFLGRLADRVGHAVTNAVAFLLCLAGLLLLLVAPNLALLALGGAVFALGLAGTLTSTLALVIERADPRHRGAAMGTYTASFPVGQSIGAALSGLAIEVDGYGAMYLGAMAVAAMAVLITVANWRALGSEQRGARRTEP